jgi:hypothetical protein
VDCPAYGGRRDRGGRLWRRLVHVEVLELFRGSGRQFDRFKRGKLQLKRNPAGKERR